MQQKTNTIKTKTKHNKKENEPHQINQQNNNKKKTNIFFATMVRWSCLLFMTSNSCRNPNKSQTAWPAHLRSLSASHNKCSVLIYIYDR